MRSGIKRSISNYACNSKLNKKIVRIKRSFEEIEEILKRSDKCREKR